MSPIVVYKKISGMRKPSALLPVFGSDIDRE